MNPQSIRSNTIQLITIIIIIFSILLAPLQSVSATTVSTNSVSRQASTTSFSCVDFSSLAPNTSVEGLGAVEENLNISSSGTAVVVAERTSPTAYFASNEEHIINGGVSGSGGFYDTSGQHDYTFTFSPGLAVSTFSLRLLDFGDWNNPGATWHQVSLIAYDATDNVVDSQTLEYNSTSAQRPTSPTYGNLFLTGDAVTAEPGEPGNYTFVVNGAGITRLELAFDNDITPGEPSDPFYALDVLCFEPDTPDIPNVGGSTCVDFAALGAGTSVEGSGTIFPDFNISTSSGDAAVIVEGQSPTAYFASNASGNINGMTDSLGGFHDLAREHQYTFTFENGVSVNSFGLQLLDFGDWNSVLATWHQITLTAYNNQGDVVDSQILEYTTDAQRRPQSPTFGNLYFTGDAVTASPGQPGNYTFITEGTGITRVELRFDNNVTPGRASDPFFGLDLLCFEPEIDYGSTCVDFAALGARTSVEGPGTVFPDFNISTSSGDAVVLVEGQSPTAYFASNASGTINGMTDSLGGFYDLAREHQYTFTFENGVSVNSFGLQLLDFGDWNSVLATWHQITLTAYNNQGDVVDSQILEYTTDAQRRPQSPTFGNLYFTGDAVTASPGQPGNYTFITQGTGITRVELRFDNDVAPDQASDPFFGLDLLCFEPEQTPPPTDTPLTCEDLGYTTIAEDSWQEHVIDGMAPITLGYARPSAADYAIVNTGWEWTGNPSQEQVTEMHSVVTPFGTVTSQDYGDEELAGQILWFGAPQGVFTQPSLQVTIDYAGDGSQPDSHRSHGRIAWCDNPAVDPPPPNQPLTCEDIGLEKVDRNVWGQHIIRAMSPAIKNFTRPGDANYVIINTGWVWSGLPGQHQVTEMHSVSASLGTVASNDYGDEELRGQTIWYNALQGAFSSGNLPVTIDYAGNGSDPGSHFSKGLVNWCRDPNAPAASSTLLQPLGDNGAQVEVAYTCSDAAPTLVSATMNGYTVEDGQVLWLVPNDDSFANTVDGGLMAIYGPAFSLAVTCADADGNQSTTIVVPDLGGE